MVEALEYTVGLLKAQVDRPSTFKDVREALSTDFFGPKNPIATNVLGAFVMEQWYLNVLAENSPNVDITVQPFKGRDGQPLTLATGDAWAIPKGAKNPDAACEFMKVMTATDSWVAAAQARAKTRQAEKKPFTGVYTANREAFERINTEVVKPIGNPKFDDAVKVVQSVQDAAYAIPSSGAGAEFKQAWEEAVNSVLTGEMSAQDALKQADQDAQDALDKAGGG